MNRFITVLGFSLAVSGFTAIFTQDRLWIALSGAIALFACICLFALEALFRKNGSLIWNYIAYVFQKAKLGCIVEEQRYYYERLDAFNWEFTKKYQLTSKSRGFDRFNDRFCWSCDSSMSTIEPSEPNQRIGNIRKEEIWTVFTIHFNTVLPGHPIYTGAVISNLNDPTRSASPFLTAPVLPKVKRLLMTVKIPAEFKPIHPRLEIYTSSSIGSPAKVEPLQYSEATQEINMPAVKYPRAGWRYVIVWEYESE